MSAERPQPPEDVYGLTERERLWDRISDKRFQAILAHEETAIHEIEVSTNNYGEFLFVSTSRSPGESRACVTFFGLGYHEHRERWLTEEWFWYHGNAFSQVMNKTLSKEEATQLLQERREEIAHLVGKTMQSGRGKLFEMLADLTDDDGAISELEDLGDDLADWLSDGLE
jgi:hypothetical protein